MPYAKARTERRYPNRDSTARYVHYTTAENALKIIQSKRLWMRNTACMSDYREVAHGHDLLLRLFKRFQDDFISTLDACCPGVAREAIGAFDQRWNATRTTTHIACLSEHYDAEDMNGRLSMWRSFGSGSTPRVALVVRLPWFTGATLKLNVVFSPVAYFTDDHMATELSTVIRSIRENSTRRRSGCSR